jgi:glyoxylase-like metal-dependent hydrolase (beta-lactamase superfamily II)
MTIYVDILIKAFTLRFGLLQGAPYYVTSGEYDATHDDLDQLVGLTPDKGELYKSNMGFVSVCTTTLIRGTKNIVVDPGNFHVGFYGALAQRLHEFNLSPEDIDTIVNTHGHHDHNQSNFVFSHAKLIWGEEQRDHIETLYWPGYSDVIVQGNYRDTLRIKSTDDKVEIEPNIWVISTPGHAPGSISVLVDNGDEKIAIIGDLAMNEEWYKTRHFSHWYDEEQTKLTNCSLDKIASWKPTRIIPGHGSDFKLE